MRKRVAAVVLSVAVFTLGAGPSSQPTSQPVADYPALRARMADLMRQLDRLTARVHELEAENISLKASLAQAQPASRPAAPNERLARIRSMYESVRVYGSTDADVDALRQRFEHELNGHVRVDETAANEDHGKFINYTFVAAENEPFFVVHSERGQVDSKSIFNQ